MGSNINATPNCTALPCAETRDMTHRSLKSVHGCVMGAINSDSSCFSTGQTTFKYHIVLSLGASAPHLMHGSLGLPDSAPKRHLDRFSCFLGAHAQTWPTNRHTHTDRPTDHVIPCIAIDRCIAAMWPNNNKLYKNFDERPHRRFVTPRGGEWIRPTLTPLIHAFLGPHESAP